MYKSLAQILSAARLIARPQGAGYKDLIDATGLSRRSVQRLLGALEDLGYPTYNMNEGQRESRFRIVEGRESLKWWMPPLSLSFDLEDRVILDYLFSSGEASPGLEVPIAKLRKKLGLIGASVGYALEPLPPGVGGSSGRRRILHRADVIAKPLSQAGVNALTVLLDAADKHRVCVVSYASRESGEVKTYRIHPLALFESEGALYVFVEVPYYGSIRILALERIREVEATEDDFTPPEGFDAEARLSDPFGIIVDEPFRAKIRFSEEQAPYIEERDWQGHASLAKDSDGSLLFEIETSSAFGIKRWVMGFGADAEVLGPEWLRKEVAKELAAAAALYVKRP